MESNRSGGQASEPTKRIELIDEIGSGSYAKVYRAQYLPVPDDATEDTVSDSTPSEYFAAKVINLRIAPTDFTSKFLPRELEICKKVNHENVVRTYEIVKQSHKIILMMDYASRGDLLAYCRLVGAMSDRITKPIFRQIVNGTEYLHDLGIIHRDLKCENILLCSDNRVVLADLGFARVLDDQDVSKTFCGSAAYAAPELIHGKPYTGFAPDIWSIGCILFILCSHMMPYRDDNVKILAQDQKKPPHFPREVRDKLNPALKLFIEELLTYECALRPNIKEVKNASWLAN